MTFTLFKAAKIITSYADPNLRSGHATAMLVCGERILEVGDFDTLRSMVRDAQIIDYGSRVLSPGFIDAHAHPSIVAEDVIDGVDVSPLMCGSAAELAQRACEKAATLGTGEWVRCYGYDPTEWVGQEPVTRDLLDAAVPDHPVVVIQASYHLGVLNSAALALAHYQSKDDAPAGGELGTGTDGRLDGTVYEQALFDVVFPAKSSREPVMDRASEPELRAGLKTALQRMHATGITSVVDALAGQGAIELYQRLQAAGELTMRVSLLVPYEVAEPLWELRLERGFGSHQLRLLGVKLVADGAIAGRTCAVDEPFQGGDEGLGLLLLDAAQLEERIRQVSDAGLVAAVHANGERAIRSTLDALEAIRRDGLPDGFRHRIEHCSLVKPDLVERMRRLDVCAVPFATYIHQHGKKLLSWYGRERLERMFPHRTLLDGGITVAGSSDYPCATYDPLIGVRTCVTRWASGVSEVLGPSQRITPDEAMALYTLGGAMSEGQEAEKGELLAGRLADFVVLNIDPAEAFTPDGDELRVEATYVGGNQVWPS